ncbi:MAG TPA: hypothetical protein VFM54_13330 [Micromonosporaceae bacterium]|nr:hypothetical protein [Micromonosporaceae bacterium]
MTTTMPVGVVEAAPEVRWWVRSPSRHSPTHVVHSWDPELRRVVLLCRPDPPRPGGLVLTRDEGLLLELLPCRMCLRLVTHGHQPRTGGDT